MLNSRISNLDMKILVCIAKTPDTTTKVSFIESNTQLDESNITWIINPYDEWYSLVRALELKEAGKAESIVLINVGDAENDAILRKALAIGGDSAVRIEASGLDAEAVGREIAKYAQENSFDLVFTGKESIDYNNGSVGGVIAAEMKCNFVPLVTEFDLDGSKITLSHAIEGGSETLELQTPCVISTQKGLAEQRIPNMRGIMAARSKPLEVVPAASSESNTEILSYELPAPKEGVKMIDAENMDELVKLLHTEAKVI